MQQRTAGPSIQCTGSPGTGYTQDPGPSEQNTCGSKFGKPWEGPRTDSFVSQKRAAIAPLAANIQSCPLDVISASLKSEQLRSRDLHRLHWVANFAGFVNELEQVFLIVSRHACALA